MLIFNHPLIKSEKFYQINSIEDISHTPSNSIVRFRFSDKNAPLITFCQENGVKCAVDIENITQAILASNLGANFLIAPQESAKAIQNIAETYLFDAKILAISDDIEQMALLGIDGVIIESL